MRSIFLAWLSVAVLACADAAELPLGIAATVNGRALSEKVVESFIANNCAALGIDPKSEAGQAKLPEVRAAVLDEMIERSLIAEETEKRGIAPSKEQIDAAEKTTITFWGNEDRYAEFLNLNGFTREEYREQVLRSAAAGKALTASLVAELTVSPEEVKDYYEKHQTEAAMQWPERAAAAHILFNTMPGVIGTELKAARKLKDGAELDRAIKEEIERKRKLSEQVQTEAAKPDADFAALARKYSEDPGTREGGGALGVFPMGTHAVELDQAAFSAKAGEVPPVIQTPSGFHVLKVSERKPAGPKSLEEAGPSIRQLLLRIKQAGRLTEWLAQAREHAVIVTK